MKSLSSSIASLVVVAWCSSSPTGSIKTQAPIDLYRNITTARIQYITAEEARKNNVAHMVMKVKWEVAWICHFWRVMMEVQWKTETFIGTAGHCISPDSYEGDFSRIDYVLARSLTRLYKEWSWVTFETTDRPLPLLRSPLYGQELHWASVSMYWCLPDGKNKNSSICFQMNGTSYLKDWLNGKATVFVDRTDYIGLLKKANRSCEEAYISWVSGNNFRDSQGRVVWFTSTAVNACGLLYKEQVLNTNGIPVRVNAFPITFEPIRQVGNNGKSRIILN